MRAAILLSIVWTILAACAPIEPDCPTGDGGIGGTGQCETQVSE